MSTPDEILNEVQYLEEGLRSVRQKIANLKPLAGEGTITLAEAARRLNVSRETAHQWVKKGKLHRTPDKRVPVTEILRLQTPARRSA